MTSLTRLETDQLRRLEEMRKTFDRLRAERIRAEGEVERLTRDLEEARALALSELGTDDEGADPGLDRGRPGEERQACRGIRCRPARGRSPSQAARRRAVIVQAVDHDVARAEAALARLEGRRDAVAAAHRGADARHRTRQGAPGRQGRGRGLHRGGARLAPAGAACPPSRRC